MSLLLTYYWYWNFLFLVCRLINVLSRKSDTYETAGCQSMLIHTIDWCLTMGKDNYINMHYVSPTAGGNGCGPMSRCSLGWGTAHTSGCPEHLGYTCLSWNKHLQIHHKGVKGCQCPQDWWDTTGGRTGASTTFSLTRQTHEAATFATFPWMY